MIIVNNNNYNRITYAQYWLVPGMDSGIIACFTIELRFFIMNQKHKSLVISLPVPPGNRFTKGLMQNLNLLTHLKLKYNIKSLNYIQKSFRFQASILIY